MIRSLGEELLLVLDNKDEKEPYEAWYVVVNPVSMDILWAFSRQNTRFLKMLHIDTQKHQLLIEEIDTSHKKFQYCWFSYESLNGSNDIGYGSAGRQQALRFEVQWEVPVQAVGRRQCHNRGVGVLDTQEKVAVLPPDEQDWI